MKSLFDYDILVHDVFYRTHHILEYIKLNPNMSDLDKLAIKATIMDALVSEDLINPMIEVLDFENLAITKHSTKKTYRYEQYPSVMGIPYAVKQAARLKCIKISGSAPVSFTIAKPSQKENEARYCLYDANMAFSSLFSKHTFYDATYSSPTRKNIIVTERPFVEVLYKGVPYLVDMLTKRYFKSDTFKRNYGFKIKSIKISTSYTPFQKEYYKNQIVPSVCFSTYLHLLESKRKDLEKIPKYAELLYEIDKSKEYYPKEWERKEDFEKYHQDILYASSDGIVIKKLSD